MSSIAFWPEGQGALAALSARGRLILVEGSGHYIHIERPAEVVDAIREVTVSATLRASASTTSSGATAP
jgi:pimeloyl-ACP methyl ester carboxylesterase